MNYRKVSIKCEMACLAAIQSACSVYELLFGSSSNEDESEEEYELFNHLVESRKRRRRSGKGKPIRVQLFVEITVEGSNDSEFQQDFSMPRQSFDMLLARIGPMLSSHPETLMGRLRIDAKKQLLAVIWLLATPDSYRY
jgi:hypothetical protein